MSKNRRKTFYWQCMKCGTMISKTFPRFTHHKPTDIHGSPFFSDRYNRYQNNVAIECRKCLCATVHRPVKDIKTVARKATRYGFQEER